jgi:hypothetical protein
MQIKVKTAIAAFLILACLIGCGQTTIIQNLQITLDAITAAFPIIAGLTTLPPATVTDVENYLDATNSALAQATTILAGPGTDAQKAAQITAAFAAIAQPVVPAQYASIVTLIGTVAKDVATFLASLPAVTTTTTTTLSTANRAALSHASVSATYNKIALAGRKK